MIEIVVYSCVLDKKRPFTARDSSLEGREERLPFPVKSTNLTPINGIRKTISETLDLCVYVCYSTLNSVDIRRSNGLVSRSVSAWR